MQAVAHGSIMVGYKKQAVIHKTNSKAIANMYSLKNNLDTTILQSFILAGIATGQ